HDTLLQGFLSASMQLHVAVDSLPSDHPVGRKLQPILALVQRVIEEGRTAVRGLRSTPLDDDLEAGFGRVPMDLGLAPSVDFKIVVEGRPRPLQPLIRDDVLRIGREALANAIRHASATQIDVELDYGPRALRVSVRDNGCGIDEHVLRSGRDGHWGRSGMRERADRISGKLRVLSRPDAGTEVELLVPQHVAFASVDAYTKEVSSLDRL